MHMFRARERERERETKRNKTNLRLFVGGFVVSAPLRASQVNEGKLADPVTRGLVHQTQQHGSVTPAAGGVSVGFLLDCKTKQEE